MDRLEEKKKHLTSLAEAVSSAKAAEQAAISVGLPPIVLSQDSMALDSDLEEQGVAKEIPPPSYEFAVQGKDLFPAVNLVTMMVHDSGNPASKQGNTEKTRQEADQVQATTSNPTILQKISALLNSDKGLNGTFGALNADDTGVEVVEEGDFEFQNYQVQEHDGGSNQDPDASRTMALKDLMPKAYRGELTVRRTVKTKSVVQFVIVGRSRGTDDEWEFISKEELTDMLNEIEVKNSSTKNGLSTAYDYSNMWGLVPILGLRSRNLCLLDKYRELIDAFGEEGEKEYTTFPRLGLERKFAITIMLWQTLASLPLEMLPRNLLDRNPDLQGGLRIGKVKKFKDSDLDVRGDGMAGVRLVQIETTKEFRESLFFFPRSYRFGLGSGRVIIRGGDRVDESDARAKSTGNKRRSAPARRQGENRREQAAHNLSSMSVQSLISQGGDDHLNNAAAANMQGQKKTNKPQNGTNDRRKNEQEEENSGFRAGSRSSSRLRGAEGK